MIPFIIGYRKRGGYFGSIRTDKNIMREVEYQRFGIGEIMRYKSASIYSEDEKRNIYSVRIEKSGRSRRV